MTAVTQGFTTFLSQTVNFTSNSNLRLLIFKVKIPLLKDCRLLSCSKRMLHILSISPLSVCDAHLSRFGGELKVGPLHNGVHRAGLLAQATVDALGHVNVIAACQTNIQIEHKGS